MSFCKRIFAAVVFVFFPFSIFSMGIGAQSDSSFGFSTVRNEKFFPTGIACTIKNDNYPIVFAFCTDFDKLQNSFEFYFTADYWILRPLISSNCTFFAGPGTVAGTSLGSDFFAIYFAPRAVFGFSWILYDGFLEPFVQIGIQPETRLSDKLDYAVKLPVNIGARFYY